MTGAGATRPATAQESIDGVEEPSAASYGVPPVSRAFALLRHIAAGNRCRNISRTAASLSINRTTLIRLLQTLERERMIERIDEDAGYRLGTGIIALASLALDARDVVQAARPVLARMSETLNLSAHLGILDGREIVYLARTTPNAHLVSNVREGTRLPVHATTMGRILLGEMSAEARAALLGAPPLPSYSGRTPTTLAAVDAQVAEDRLAGVAWSVGNFEAGIGSCAAAVFDHRGNAAAAINVSGPESAFAVSAGRRSQIRETLLAAARAISAALGQPDA